MTNVVKRSADPLFEPIQRLENLDYKIGQATRVLLDLTNAENEVDPNSLDYIACAFKEHADELSETFGDIRRAYTRTNEGG